MTSKKKLSDFLIGDRQLRHDFGTSIFPQPFDDTKTVPYPLPIPPLPAPATPHHEPDMSPMFIGDTYLSLVVKWVQSTDHGLYTYYKDHSDKRLMPVRFYRQWRPAPKYGGIYTERNVEKQSISFKVGVSKSEETKIAGAVGVDVDGFSAELSTEISRELTLTQENDQSLDFSIPIPGPNGEPLAFAGVYELYDCFEIFCPACATGSHKSHPAIPEGHIPNYLFNTGTFRHHYDTWVEGTNRLELKTSQIMLSLKYFTKEEMQTKN
jgi:hypothetical protein